MGENTTMDTRAAEKLAVELTTAFENGDLETIERIYAPNFILWRNTDDREEGRAAGIQSIVNLHNSFAKIRLERLKRSFFDGGYVQQFVFSAVTHEGVAMSGPMCMVILIEAGRILRVDEYYDSVQDSRSEKGHA
jgi:ketosteroid isomerase-like protein